MHLEQRTALCILTFASSVSKPGAQVRNLSFVSFPPFFPGKPRAPLWGWAFFCPLLCWRDSPVKLIKLLLYIDLCAAGLSWGQEEWGADSAMSRSPQDQGQSTVLQSN